ncbi:MAG: hypothetical protein Q9199_002759 [Rusavskia elegans]
MESNHAHMYGIQGFQLLQVGRTLEYMFPATCQSFDKDQAVDISIAPQVHYVLRNIYAINNLFTSWYTALDFASNNAQLKIQSIVTELDPPQEQNVFLNQILTALSIGLSFIGGPQAGALVSAAAATAAQTFVKAVQQAPTVAAALWPSGTENSQSIQISNLESDLSLGADQLADIANRGLEFIMSDMPSFIAFAQSGAFSGEKTIALPDQSFEVTLALKTYILTTAMTANKWKAHALPYSKEQIPQNSACTFDSNNICGEYTYYSDATQRVYTLTRNGYTGVRPNELMNDIIDKKWADLALMFDGAYECTVAGRMGQDPFANFGVGGDFSTACVSQLNFCIACGIPCPVPEIEGVCPFGRCVDDCD